MALQIGEHFTRVQIAHDRSLGNHHFEVAPPAAVQVLAHSRHPVFAATVRMITECDEGRHVVIGDEPHRPAVTAVAAVRTAEDDRPLATETHATRSAVTAAHVQLCFVDEAAHVTLPRGTETTSTLLASTPCVS